MYGDMDRLVGQTLESVEYDKDRDYLTITLQGGRKIVYSVEGDCCSRSWIEHLTVPDDVKGAVVLSYDSANMDDAESGEWELIQVYESRIHTNRGSIVMEYRNSSNGYYGGYVILVSDSGGSGS